VTVRSHEGTIGGKKSKVTLIVTIKGTFRIKSRDIFSFARDHHVDLSRDPLPRGMALCRHPRRLRPRSAWQCRTAGRHTQPRGPYRGRSGRILGLDGLACPTSTSTGPLLGHRSHGTVPPATAINGSVDPSRGCADSPGLPGKFGLGLSLIRVDLMAFRRHPLLREGATFPPSPAVNSPVLRSSP
jgi:hypothetical protein